MAISYDYYHIFYFVAKYRSFTKAAEVLLNSQPNISRAMNNLEEQIGCQLFERSNRGVTLTPEGERLFAHVRVAQAQLQAAEEDLTGRRSLHSGMVSVSTNETALHGVLLAVLRRFREAYPGVHIRVSSDSTPMSVQAVRSGMAELAVVTTPTGDIRPLETIRIRPFRNILVAGPLFAELAQKTRRLRDLQPHPLIVLNRDTKSYEFFDRLFLRHGLRLQPAVEVPTIDQVLPMVESNLGLGFLPREFAAESLARGEIIQIPLEEELPERHICLVKEKDRPLSMVARQLERQIMAYQAI